MDIQYLFGATGTGKSHLANKEAGPASYWKDGGTKWFHGYEGEAHVVIEEFRSGFPYGALLQILDKWPYRVESKGDMSHFVCKKLWITSHYAPYQLYANVNDKSELFRRLGVGQVWRFYKDGEKRYRIETTPDGRTDTGTPEELINEEFENALEELEIVSPPTEPVTSCACDGCEDQNAQCLCDCHFRLDANGELMYNM